MTASSYQGKTALITGGSSGIGLALAKQLAQAGANVVILARSPQKLEAACDEILAARLSSNCTVRTLAADIADGEATTQALQSYTQKHGVPDILINNAGVTRPGLVEEIDLAVFREMMEVNYLGMVAVTKALLPGFMQRRSGHIINVSSIAGFLGIYGYSAYGPSKFAVRGFSDVLRYEMAQYGVKVSVVFPPDTQTPQLEYETPYKPDILKILDESNKVMQPEDVARIILREAARGRYTITPGFDSSFYYFLTGLVGNLTYTVMDFMIAQARRRLRTAKNQRAQ